MGICQTQLTARKVTSTRQIAEACIHVECALERLKQFLILEGGVDLSLIHVIEEIFQVCTFLTNSQRPIANDISFVK